ncbi:MAG: hypothetical protein U9P68_13435 [Pseudomonadota bacterium]|nr:hypothetical protein [Pseudomonadota bacterium]
MASDLSARLRIAPAESAWWGLVAALLLLGALIKLVFAAEFAGAEVRNDHFRHIALIVMPLLESGDLRLLWTNAHPSAFIHLHEMATLFLLDGDFRWEAYVGVLASFATFGLFVWLVHRGGREEGGGYPSLTALAVLIPWVGILSDAPFHWTLIYMQSSFMLIGSLYAWYVVRSCRDIAVDIRTPASGALLLKLYLLGFVALALHADFSLLFILGLLGVFLIHAVYWRAWDRLAVCGVMLALAATRFLVFGDAGNSHDEGMLAFVLASLRDLPGYVEVFGRALAGGMLGEWASKLPEGSSALTAVCRGLWFLLSLAFVAALIRAAISKGVMMTAGAVMGFCAVFALATAFGRSDGDYPWGMLAPRYFLVYNVAAACFLWVAVDALGAWLKRVRPELAPALARFGTLAILLPVAWVTTTSAWQGGEFRRGVSAQRELATYMVIADPDNTFRLTGFVTGANPEDIYRPVLEWMRALDTGVFAAGYPVTREVTDYRRARAVWTPDRAQSLIPAGYSGRCFNLSGAPLERAYRLEMTSDQRHPMGLRIIDTARREVADVRFILSGETTHYGVLPAGPEYRFCWQRDIELGAFAAMPLDTD